MITKHKVETFIVPRLGAALPADATRLWNPTTDADQLAIGGFSFYRPFISGAFKSGDPETFSVANSTVTATPEFRVILRRDESQDRNPLQPRKYIESGDIKADCIVSFRGAVGRLKRNGCWLIGAVGTTAATGVPVLDETEYMVNAALRGWRTDIQNGYNTPLKMGRFTTPDYATTIYTTTNQRREHILGNVAYDFNSSSPADIVAICLANPAPAAPPTGAGQATLLNTLIALPLGSTVIIGYTDAGQPIRLTLDAQLLAMFTSLIAAGIAGLTGATTYIVPYANPTAANLAVAGRIITGGTSAGSTVTAIDRLLFVSLNKKLAFYDEVFQTKERVNVGLDGGFGTTTNSQRAVTTSEGAGYGRELAQVYRDMFGNRLYPGGKPWQPNSVRYGNEIQENAIYDVYTLEYCANRTATSGLLSVSPQKVVIAIINTTVGNATLNPFFTGIANPQRAYIQDRLNAWVASSGFPHTTVNLLP